MKKYRDQTWIEWSDDTHTFVLDGQDHSQKEKIDVWVDE